MPDITAQPQRLSLTPHKNFKEDRKSESKKTVSIDPERYHGAVHGSLRRSRTR